FFRKHEAFNRNKEFAKQFGFARAAARTDHYLPLPGPCFVLVITDRVLYRKSERSESAVRPQAEIDAIGGCLARRLGREFGGIFGELYKVFAVSDLTA